jgi:hypothetical protein
MEVPRIKSWIETSTYLDMLAQTVINDVAPLLNTPGGAPHAIAREVFCYVDYLGALYAGKGPSETAEKGYLQTLSPWWAIKFSVHRLNKHPTGSPQL